MYRNSFYFLLVIVPLYYYFYNSKLQWIRNPNTNRKNLVPTAVPIGRKHQVTLRHFSEAPESSYELKRFDLFI